jgi:hypothetical protein
MPPQIEEDQGLIYISYRAPRISDVGDKSTFEKEYEGALDAKCTRNTAYPDQ